MKKIKSGRQPNRSLAGDIGVGIVLVIFGCFFAFPLVYVICSAFKPLDELFVFPPKLFVRNPTTKNITDLFLLMNKQGTITFTRYAFNSLFITVVGTGGHILIASMAASVPMVMSIAMRVTCANLGMPSLLSMAVSAS